MSGPALAPCDAFVAPLGARAVGGLDDSGRAALEAHLAAGCAGCAALAADLEAALDAVRLPEEEPAPGGWERVRLRLDDSTAAAAPAEPVTVKVRCTYCRDDLAKGAKACCAACLAPHHADCFEEHGRCAAPGCTETRTLAAAPARRTARLQGRRLPWLLSGALVLGGGSVAAWQVAERQGLAAVRERELAASLPLPEPVPLFESQPMAYWLEALTDRSGDRRVRAQTALASFGEPAVVKTARVLEHTSPEVRQSAALALSELAPHGRAAIRPLARHLAKDDTVWVRMTCADSLKRILAELLRREPAAPDLLEGLAALERSLAEEPEVKVRAQVVDAFSWLVPTHGLDPLARALRQDPEEEIRRSAATWLLRAAPTTEAVVGALTSALATDATEAVRLQVLSGVLQVKPEALRGPARAAVVQLLLNPVSTTALREEAARQLANYEPAAERDLVPLTLVVDQLEAARNGLQRDQPLGVLRALLQRLPELPPRAQFGALQYAGSALSSENVDPQGTLRWRLLGPEVTTETRLAAAWLEIQGGSQVDPTYARLTPLVLDDLVRAFDVDPESDVGWRVQTIVAALGPRASVLTERLVERARKPLDSDCNGQAIELLASVAPTDSRSLELALAACETDAERMQEAGVDALITLGPHAGAAGARALGAWIVGRGRSDEDRVDRALEALDALRLLAPGEALERFLGGPMTDDQRDKALMLLRRLGRRR